MSSGLVSALSAGRTTLPRQTLNMTSGPECLDWVRCEAEVSAKPSDKGPNVCLKGFEEHPMGAEDVGFLLLCLEPVLINEERLGVGRLDVDDRLDHRVDLPLDVVRLIDHERDGVRGLSGCRIATT